MPHPKADTIRRERLLTLLGNNLDKKLVLITADAGYGKTTLLAQLGRDACLPCMFYDLDKGDSDLAVFYSYLIAGIRQVDPALVQYSEELAKSATADGEAGKNIELLFGTLINELHQKRREQFFIIFDNYHNIAGDSIVHRALDFFIDHQPEKIHVIIASRCLPHLPSLAKWRAKQDLFNLTRENLTFTGDEIAALLNDASLAAPSAEDVRQVAAYTEGWITGIRLILQSTKKDETTIAEIMQRQMDTSLPLFEYFANEILSSEPAEMRDFLIKCSILDVMTPAACDAILDSNNAALALQSLEQRHLFISLAGPEAYKYHHLFREFLLLRIRDNSAELHNKAAVYYQRQGDTARAIEHSLRAKDYRRAATLICLASEETPRRHQFTAVDDWLRRMPKEAFSRNPGLHIAACLCYCNLGRFEEAQAHCDKALALLAGKNQAIDRAKALLQKARISGLKNEQARALSAARQALAFIRRHRLPGEIKIDLKETLLNICGIALSELGRYGRAVSCMQQARRLAQKIGSPERCFIVENNLAMIYTYSGQKHLAFGIYHDMMQQIKGHYFYRIGSIYYNATILAVHRGDLEWAEQTTEQGWCLCQPYDDIWSKAHLHYCFGITCLQKGLWDDARCRFNQAAELASGIGLSSLKFAAQRDTILAYRYQGDYGACDKHLGRLMQTIGNAPSRSLTNLQIEQSLLASALGNQQQAEATIRSCLAEARRRGWKMIAFLALLAAAEIAAARKDERRAVYLLRRVVRDSKSGGNGGLLNREFRACPRLAALAIKKRIDPGYLEQFLPRAKAADPASTQAIEVRMLGRFELAAGGSVARLNRKTTRAIISFMLLHPRNSYTWESIAAWAWPESTAHAAHLMFKRDICEIYGCSPAVKNAIACRNYHYSIKPDSGLWVDAVEFQNLLDQSEKTAAADERMGILERAVGLYQGPLLPDLYYDWIDSLRNSLEARYTSALGALAQWHYDNRQYEKSVLFCRQYLAADELDEKIHRLLMANYIRQGHHSRALKQYEQLTAMLRQHFQCEPSDETVSLIRNIA